MKSKQSKDTLFFHVN